MALTKQTDSWLVCTESLCEWKSTFLNTKKDMQRFYSELRVTWCCVFQCEDSNCCSLTSMAMPDIQCHSISYLKVLRLIWQSLQKSWFYLMAFIYPIVLNLFLTRQTWPFMVREHFSLASWTLLLRPSLTLLGVTFSRSHLNSLKTHLKAP